ncbi:MAG: PKD domain-containing protein, partial [Thermodesulfobacteria bacterium]|nr:PKD domain-containing protein [Thermodesulfobacteriota bacterium]
FMQDPKKTPDVRNNIFVDNVEAGVRSHGRGYAYNLFYKNGGVGACTPEYLWCVRAQFGGYEDEHSFTKSHNIIADPLFRDEKGHDFHLRPGSPAIDAGDPNPAFDDKNFPPSLGKKRNDLGVYGGPHTIAEKRGPNHRPRADAGKDMVVYAGKRVVLDGSKSLDPDGDALTYHWSVVSGPSRNSIRIVGKDKAKASLVVKKPGTYTVQLVVKDRWGLSSKPAKVRIKVPSNRPPKAAISDVISTVSVGDSITLYGSPSSDPDGDKLSYHWRLAFKPSKSNAVLGNANGKECTLQIDADGGYAVELVVSDGKAKSEPAVVYINTKATSSSGIRRVPQDYPTIQSAIDAAQPGDNIVVEKGHYKELISLDKSVNLIGKDWPVIDGGSPNGNRNTISIFYLGDRAGKIEGFVITGGGTGELGHGINIWDSSPEIVNNKITGNHHGIGIHGSESQTGRTKVHGNLIYDNMVGIGNGKDSHAHIYQNKVYDNKVVGIGCRGKAAPIIEHNLIYNNHLGVGVREVSAPVVRGNKIFDNVDGLVVGPLSTVKSFAFDDIVIQGNLIAKNHHIGINITSFNLSKVIITDNVIDSNNLDGRRFRAGGVVLGYPEPGTFSVVVRKNIISNNKGGGIINYLGPEDFQTKGAKIENDLNRLWNNTVDFLDCKKGPGDVVADPGFVSTDPLAKDGYLFKKGPGGPDKVYYQGAGLR